MRPARQRLTRLVETYYNRRSDDSKQWGPALRWRPAADTPMGRATFVKLFLFNLLPYFLGLFCLGVALVAFFPTETGISLLNGETIDLATLKTILGTIAVLAGMGAVTLDYLACTLLVTSWNRRARLLQSSKSQAVPPHTRPGVAVASMPRHWWTSADRTPARPLQQELPQQQR